ncbi:MAG: sialate O-acetylesterase [bacterium]
MFAVFSPVIFFPLNARVRLPDIFSDNMILQRGMEVPVWGWAAPEEKITVRFGETKVSAAADNQGRWQVKLPAIKAGGPFKMTVKGSNMITICGILVGEVWLASGQSNMAMTMAGGIYNSSDECAAADYPQIRFFNVPQIPSGIPLENAIGEWTVCTPKSVISFSAAAYFFARRIHRELNIPVAVISASVGGSFIEQWLALPVFDRVPALAAKLESIKKANRMYTKALPRAVDAIEEWAETSDDWVKHARSAIAAGKPLPPIPALPEHELTGRKMPTQLFNGMIHPLIPYSIRGLIWYQGESNVGDGSKYYSDLMQGMIKDWRNFWGIEFSFYFVQPAPYRYGKRPDFLPLIWEAQNIVLSSTPKTGMAVTTDVGELDNIHPGKKQEIGERLALWALAGDYGSKGIVYSGPLYKAMKVEGHKIRLKFDHTGGELVSRDGKPLSWFSIAGRDSNFIEAAAEIQGNDILVWSAKVKEPLAARFGWNQEAQPNLVNKAGLPASPFRTDSWQ